MERDQRRARPRATASSFELRVGVNTGEVLAGAVGDAYTVIGDTVNVASRLQAAGAAGQRDRGRAHRTRPPWSAVDYRELPPLDLKGKAEPVPAWEAIGAARGAARAPRPRPRESPLVGRDRRADLLESLYDRVARERRPHLVTLLGEAGVGKSRLLRELRERLGSASTSRPAFREGRCLPYGSGIVYWALGEVIRAEFDDRATPTPRTWPGRS